MLSILRTISILFIILKLPISIIANDFDSFNIYLYESNTTCPEINVIISHHGHRLPSHPTLCLITRESVTLNHFAFQNGEIGYEIWDNQTNFCILSTDYEFEFINFIYSNIGAYTIKLKSNDYILAGNLSIDGSISN
jgi:hypothetical protein